MEALVVVIVCSLQRVSASAPAFSRLHLHHSGCFDHRLADALPPLSLLVDTLLPFCSSGCFAATVVLVEICLGQMLWHRGGWMLCHLCCIVDLCTLDVVVSLCGFNCMVVARFVGLGESPPSLFLLILFVVRSSSTSGWCLYLP